MVLTIMYKCMITGSIGMIMTLMVIGCSGASDESEKDSSSAASQQISSGFEISSTQFTDKRPRKRIPNESTCHGGDVSPPLSWEGWPEGTQSFVLISEDVDHETGIWVHWVLYNIPVGVYELDAGIPMSIEILPDGTTQGTNDFRNIGYNGPCIPIEPIHYSYRPEAGTPHRYYFRLYALDSMLELDPGAKKTEVVNAMESHILAQTEIIGKSSPPIVLSTKGGRGFLETQAKEGEKGFRRDEGDEKKRFLGEVTPTGEKIYNSLGELVTPTPAPR